MQSAVKPERSLKAPVPLGTGVGRAPRRDAPLAPSLAPAVPNFLIAHRRLAVFAVHLALVPLIYWMAFALRFDAQLPPAYERVYLETVAVLAGVRLATFAWFRLFSGWWRHVGMYDLAALVRAATVSSFLFVALLFLVGMGTALPRSILLLDWGLTVLLFGGIRFGVRWLREGSVTGAWAQGGRRTLIIGADDSAARLLREVRLDPSSRVHPIGILDADASNQGAELHGVRVLGTLDDLRALVDRHAIELLIVASRALSRARMRQLMEECTGLALEVKIVPALGELVDGRAGLHQLRGVEIEDLLGRVPVELDLEAVAEGVRGRTVLISGGSAS